MIRMCFAADDSRRSCGAHVKCREVSSFCEMCGARNVEVSVSVCLSVCLLAYLKNRVKLPRNICIR